MSANASLHSEGLGLMTAELRTVVEGFMTVGPRFYTGLDCSRVGTFNRREPST